MARWNWGGAAVGLLSGVEGAAKAHEKRLHDLEDQRLADERQTRREEALLAKQMAIAKYQADLQTARDDVNWQRGEESKKEQRTYQDESDMRKLELQQQWRNEDRNEARRLTAEQKEAERQFRAEENEKDREVRREIAGGKEEGGELNDKEARRLYNEAYTKAYTAAMQGVVTASPQQQQAAEMKAHQYAAQLTGFDLYGVLGGAQGGQGLLASARQEGAEPLTMPKSKGEMVEGQTYMTKRGPAVWRNGAFHTR